MSLGLRILFWVVLCMVLCSCSYLQKKGIIKSGNVSVAAVGDAGKPAELHTSDGKETVGIPSGSVITTKKVEARPATDKTPYEPAVEWTEIRFNGPSIWEKAKQDVNASTGTVDTSVALKKVEVAERRPLLYMAIACALVAGFMLYRAYPTPAFIAGGASGVFFIAWKVSGVPDWLWGLGAAAVAGAVFLYLGHERGEKAAVVAGTPVTPVPVPTVNPNFSPTATPNPPKT